MRTLLAVSILLIIMAGCNSEEQANTRIMADSTSFTRIQWLDSIVHFDTLTMGQQTKVRFRFRNTGDKPLFLADVKAGCGCTIADYTKGAIAPGKEGEVTGAFDTNKAHPGIVRKSIFVTSNTKDVKQHTLIFTGVILEKK